MFIDENLAAVFHNTPIAILHMPCFFLAMQHQPTGFHTEYAGHRAGVSPF